MKTDARETARAAAPMKRVHYGRATIDVDETQSQLLAAHIHQLCRRRRTAVHTLYGYLGDDLERSTVQLVIGHGVPTAILPVERVHSLMSAPVPIVEARQRRRPEEQSARQHP
ncbi:hypothetical protein [Herbiconiux sp. A18JL235]|uniref:Uncharacterized protein n=1 Tax=Herbiconiux sp. A18JL235 TaxID=3152363 RepID=A0AB39BM59_9MICO